MRELSLLGTGAGGSRSDRDLVRRCGGGCGGTASGVALAGTGARDDARDDATLASSRACRADGIVEARVFDCDLRRGNRGFFKCTIPVAV